MPTLQECVDALKTCRNNVATVFEAEVKDDVFDNGNLHILTTIITGLENAIKTLSGRL